VAAFSLAGSLASVAELLVAQTPPSCPPTSLRDTTRVAASEPRIWTDIFLDNRAHLLPLLRGLEARVSDLRGAIERGDAATLERLLAEARALRAQVVRP
jgi:prephenate dehydrogenase